ncbi:DUF2975 domain-containing protein [Brevibacterium sp. 50QC2O2]|uniref:DUF2975 domain-containing protein n=1 Tax=Brevibacterium sp. 50QC2O2 TaxID=2968459 RepID=UPI00211BEC45|nr:DUF2975 domain-containing protein [Brevibacterium sp. 50QC2O2]MCQ9389641.1 DUF2975 domain-containing protein [Brevibacterium sp. 50QC2O2]
MEEQSTVLIAWRAKSQLITAAQSLLVLGVLVLLGTAALLPGLAGDVAFSNPEAAQLRVPYLVAAEAAHLCVLVAIGAVWFALGRIRDARCDYGRAATALWIAAGGVSGAVLVCLGMLVHLFWVHFAGGGNFPALTLLVLVGCLSTWALVAAARWARASR